MPPILSTRSSNAAKAEVAADVVQAARRRNRCRRRSPRDARHRRRSEAGRRPRLAPECLMVLVSASRPIRSRWCSSELAERADGSDRAHDRVERCAGRHLLRDVGQRAHEVPRFQRAVTEIHHAIGALRSGCSAASGRRSPARAVRPAANCRASSRPRRAAAECRPAPVRACRAARSRGGFARR